MSFVTESGSTILDKFSAHFTATGTDVLPFGTYLSFGNLATKEKWTSQTYDESSSSKNLNFTSDYKGSKLSYKESWKGYDAAVGYDNASVTVIGVSNGTNLSLISNKSWSSTSESESTNISWTYTGGTSLKDDDFTYKFTTSPQSRWTQTATGQSGTNVDRLSIQFINANYTFNFSWSGSGSFIWESSSGGTTSEIYSGSGSYSFIDKSNNVSLSFSAKQTTNTTIKQDIFDLTSIKYITSDLSITTQKFTTVGGDELSKIADSQNDLPTISNNISSVAELFMVSDNSITITSTSGVSIDAGAGNDKVTGGTGNDTLIGAAGSDTLTGGTGALISLFWLVVIR